MEEKNKKRRESFFSLKSIKRKLGWAFGVLIFLIILFAVLTYSINKDIQTDARFVREVNAPLTIMIEQVIGYDAMLTSNAEAALLHSIRGETTDVAEHEVWYHKQEALSDNLLKIEAPALIAKSRRSAEDKELVYGYLSQLDEINLKLVDLETRAFAAMEKGNNNEAHSLLVGETYQNYKTALRDLYSKWYAEEAKITEHYRQKVLANNLKAIIINEVFGIILIIIALIIPIVIFKSVVKPIDKLTEIVEDISSGNFNVKIPSKLKKNKGEIGKLANAFEKLHESSHFALKTLVETKMAEQAKYKTFFENATDAIFIADTETRRLVDCNKAAEKLMGYSRHKILSMKADELHPKDKLKETMKGFKKQAEGKIKSVLTEVLTRDNKRIPIKINASIVKIGNKIYNQGIFIELTGKRE